MKYYNKFLITFYWTERYQKLIFPFILYFSRIRAHFIRFDDSINTFCSANMQNNSIIIYSVKFIVIIIIISEYPNTVILFGFQSRMGQSYTMGSTLFLVHTLTFTICYMISCPLAIVDKEFNNWIFRLCLLICLPSTSCPCSNPPTRNNGIHYE